MKTASWAVYLLAALLALWLLDRLLLWIERRGWIYWRRKQPRGSSLGAAVLEVQALFEPAQRHVVQVKREQRKEPAASGDPPEAGAPPLSDHTPPQSGNRVVSGDPTPPPPCSGRSAAP